MVQSNRLATFGLTAEEVHAASDRKLTEPSASQFVVDLAPSDYYVALYCDSE